MLQLSQALDTVVLNTQLDPIENITTIEERSQWLQDSKGIKNHLLGDVDFYRPYYVIAWHFWLLPENNLISGEGAKFDQNVEVCRRYLLMQRTIDVQNDLDIPIAYQADTLLGTLKADCQVCNDPISNIPTLSILGF